MNENFIFEVGMTGQTRDGRDFTIVGTADPEHTSGETLVVEVDGELSLYYSDGGYFGEGDRSEYSLRPPMRRVFIIEARAEGEPSEFVTTACPECARNIFDAAFEMAQAAADQGGSITTVTLHEVELSK